MILTLKVLVATIYAQWEGMGDVGSARYELLGAKSRFYLMYIVALNK